MAALIGAVAGDKFSLIHDSRASPVISIAAAASSAAASIRGLRHGLTITCKICDGAPLAVLALFRVEQIQAFQRLAPPSERCDMSLIATKARYLTAA